MAKKTKKAKGKKSGKKLMARGKTKKATKKLARAQSKKTVRAKPKKSVKKSTAKKASQKKSTRTASVIKAGYRQNLFVLPFDHRGSFQSKLFGIMGQPTAEETQLIASYKDIIYQGMKKAIAAGVPKKTAGILVDEQFGSHILQDAKKHGFTTACPAEKSGQDEFDFEYGNEFAAHIKKYNPTFVKVLVRYNTEGDQGMNMRQAERLKKLSDFCHKNKRYFMFELLVPHTDEQLAQVGGDKARYDREMRPDFMVQAIQELQSYGIEPDVWKLEGVETKEDAQKVSDACRAGGRKNVGVILLGRGENAEKVKHWLSTAANLPGFIGFAVGRTVFWEPLKAVKEGRMSKEQAAEQIAQTYKSFVDLWESSRG